MNIKAKLEKAPDSLFNLYCIFAAFSTYFCMYSFRKPFSVATYESLSSVWIAELDPKILFIIAQVFGYTFSKFLGIKFVSEMTTKSRAKALILLIAIAEIALLGFAIVPPVLKPVFLFINGLPLGMVWGMVFGFLEGRKSTELLGAGLSASYIVASGFVKSAGAWILSLGVSEFWMPFATGMMFLPFFLTAVFLLNQIPKPNAEDVKLRTKRKSMNADDRTKFFKTFAPGLIPLTLLYMLLTAYRDFRDNFAREIWDSLGYSAEPSIFSYSELPIAFGVLIALALLFMIKSNRKAMYTIHLIMLVGTIIIGASTLLFQFGLISPVAWMISVGLGLYLGYVPYGCILFDRLIAATHFIGTAGFMIYVTDAFGYLGSVGLMLYKNFGQANLSWLEFFQAFSYATSIICSICFVMSLMYFNNILKRKDQEQELGLKELQATSL
tara:strand:+ start:66908 stop:68227 length:1320 start_codon:yes stop_codon:yes gene_type:complete